MYPRETLHTAFQVMPEKVSELIAAVSPNDLDVRSHLSDGEAAQLLDDARCDWLAATGAGSVGAQFQKGVPGRYIYWGYDGADSHGCQFVEGIVYYDLGSVSVVETSPIALIDSAKRLLVHGPGVAAFGQLILGASLALYDGLGRNSSTVDRDWVFDEAEAVRQAFASRWG